MKKILLAISFICSSMWFLNTYGATTSLNILVPMRVLDPKLIEQFESANNCQVNVEFMSDHTGYESHLRSEVQMFDVVIANEQALIQLTTANLLRTLPENLRQNNNSTIPIRIKTPFNTEVNTYVPLFVNPMGIAYNPAVSNIPPHSTWNMLIEPDKNPYWRQHIFITSEKPKQIALAILAAHEPLTHPKKLPTFAVQWLSKLRAQLAPVNEPLELALLGQHVNAAVLFYSDYLRYKNIFPTLSFVIPSDGTYFDRFGIGWCLSSTQEKLARKFMLFMIENSDKFAKSNHLFDIKYGQHNLQAQNSQTFSSWILYDESVVLPFVPAQVSGQ